MWNSEWALLHVFFIFIFYLQPLLVWVCRGFSHNLYHFTHREAHAFMRKYGHCDTCATMSFFFFSSKLILQVWPSTKKSVTKPGHDTPLYSQPLGVRRWPAKVGQFRRLHWTDDLKRPPRLIEEEELNFTQTWKLERETVRMGTPERWLVRFWHPVNGVVIIRGDGEPKGLTGVKCHNSPKRCVPLSALKWYRLGIVNHICFVIWFISRGTSRKQPNTFLTGLSFSWWSLHFYNQDIAFAVIHPWRCLLYIFYSVRVLQLKKKIWNCQTYRCKLTPTKLRFNCFISVRILCIWS